MNYLSLFAVALLSLTACAISAEPDPALDEGYKLAFATGQAYQAVADGKSDATAFNAAVERWNAFVRKYYGENAGLLMQPMTAANADLSKSVAIGKNTTSTGIVHSIDGSGKWGPSWSTNDVNALPQNARDSSTYNTTTKTYSSDSQWLGGV